MGYENCDLNMKVFIPGKIKDELSGFNKKLLENVKGTVRNKIEIEVM